MRFIALLCIILAGCDGTSTQPTTSIHTEARSPRSAVVAFMGDSITARWDTLCEHFDQCINAGIPGETTDAMLGRFQTDVLANHPAVVAILGGTNDMYLEVASIDNIASMAEEASAQGALVVIGLVTPANNWQRMTYKGLTGEAAINAWNADLRLLAQSYGYQVANYHDAMLLPDGSQNDALFVSDLLHPNPAGYAYMWDALAPLMEADHVLSDQTHSTR